MHFSCYFKEYSKYLAPKNSLIMYPEFWGINWKMLINKEKYLKENYIKLRNVSCVLKLPSP